jgi:hypothetical protein
LPGEQASARGFRRVLDVEPGPAERSLAVAELSRWPVRVASGFTVLVPGDRGARVRRPRHRGDQEPGSCRMPVAVAYRCFRQPGSREYKLDRGDQDVTRRRYPRAPS